MSNNLKIATTAAVVAGVAGTAYCAYQYYKKAAFELPEQWTEVGTLTEINTYPIKSCGRVALDEAEVTVMGLKRGWIRDRFLMIVDEQNGNNFISARGYPEMLLIQPVFTGSVLTLKHRDMEDVTVDIKEVMDHKRRTTAYVWGVPVPVYDCGWEVSEWISRLLKKTTHELRLVIYASNKSRMLRKSTNPTYRFTKDDTGAFPDEVPYNLINQASVDDLSSRLPNTQISTRNFRPSFVLKGSKPYDEDNWKYIKIGEHVFEIIKPCFRCVLTTIDPETGVRDSQSEPLQTLKSYRQMETPEHRKTAGESPRMGVQISLRTAPGGKIALNDKIYVA